jgi:hypothetical protein
MDKKIEVKDVYSISILLLGFKIFEWIATFCDFFFLQNQIQNFDIFFPNEKNHT